MNIPLDVLEVLPGASSATVIPAGGASRTSVVHWFQEDASPAGHQVGSGSLTAVNRRVVAYVRRDQVPSLPVGSTIVGGPAHQQKTWKTVAVDQSDPDFHIAVVG